MNSRVVDAQLERGNLSGVSESVLEALAGALQLDESERTHLLDLARAANTSGRQRRTAPRSHLRPGVQRILDSISAPAYVRNNRLDLLGVNRLGRALLSDLYSHDASRPNLARYLFLDARSQKFYSDWAAVARDVVSALRIEAGRNQPLRPRPDRSHRRTLHTQRGVPNLVGQPQRATPLHLHQADAPPRRGALELTSEALELPGDTGLTIITYTVDPASPSAQTLQFLSNWANEEVPESSLKPN